MPISEIHQNSIIPNEPGILKKGNGGFHTPSPFALEHLSYVLWHDVYRCSSRYHLKRNYLESFLLLYLVSGTMELEYEGKNYTVPQGSIIFIDLRKPHRYYAKTKLYMHQYMVDGLLARAYYEQLFFSQGAVFSADKALPEAFQLLLGEMEQIIPDDNRINYLLLRIFSKMLLPESHENSGAIKDALNFIHKHYSENLSLDLLSEHVSLSKYHFSRIFKEETSFSPHAYILDLRLRQAKIYLTETSHSVEKVSSECGFTSVTHFIRAFKSANNCTPAQFRKQFQLFGDSFS